jgi:hypothetical protein
MQASDIPSKFPIPFANAAGVGYIRSIPQASQIGITAGAASLTDGFPPVNFLPVGSGGTPPFGQDMNGILNQITQWSRWQGAGALPVYDSAFSTSIGGYPMGAILSSTTSGTLWLNLADNNTTNPDTGGANWIAIPTIINTAMTFTVYGTGANFADLNAANAWLSRHRIGTSGSVTLNLAAGKFTNTTTQFLSHPDGQRITVNGSALIGGGFPAAGSFTITGSSSGARTSDTAANLALLRTRFATELAFTGASGLSFGIVGAVNNILATGDGSFVDGILFVATPNGSVSNVIGVSFGNRGFVTSQAHLATTNVGGAGNGGNSASAESASSWQYSGQIIGLSSAASGIVSSSSTIATNTNGALTAGGNVQKGNSATDNGVIIASNSNSNGSSFNGGDGFYATRGGILQAEQSVSINNGGSGYFAQNDGWIDAASSTSTGNATFGYQAINKGFVIQTGGTAGSLSPAGNTVGNANSYIVA